MDIRERLKDYLTKSKNRRSSSLRTNTFSGITLDLSRNFISKDILMQMKSLLTINRFSEKRKRLFTNKLISKTESQQVSFVYYRNNQMYEKRK